MRLEILREEPAFLALEPWWDRLLEQSATPTPFMRWDWVRLWWQVFGHDFELAVAVVYDEQKVPQAIAPLMLGHDSPGPRRHLRHLGFLGGLGPVRGERMDFLVPAGREAELTPLLCRALVELAPEWEALRLNKLPEDSPNHRWILRALGESTTGLAAMNRSECACIRLQPDWTGLQPTLRGRHRRGMNRCQRLLLELPGCVRSVATADDMEQRLDEFARLHSLHFPPGVSSFLTPEAWRFHRRLACEWIPQGRAMLAYISVNGAMVGSLYGFVEGDEFLFYQLGWDPAYADLTLGHLSIRWAVECCMQRGLRVFDMLPGLYRYKRDWAHTSRQVLDLEAYQPESLRAAAFRLFRGVKRLLPGHTVPATTTAPAWGAAADYFPAS